MLTQSFIVVNPSGFHVRPTKTFVQTAATFPCKIQVACKGKKVNGKSSLSMLTLGIGAHDEVILEIEGEQAEEAMQKLGALFTQIYD